MFKTIAKRFYLPIKKLDLLKHVGIEFELVSLILIDIYFNGQFF